MPWRPPSSLKASEDDRQLKSAANWTKATVSSSPPDAGRSTTADNGTPDCTKRKELTACHRSTVFDLSTADLIQ